MGNAAAQYGAKLSTDHYGPLFSHYLRAIPISIDCSLSLLWGVKGTRKIVAAEREQQEQQEKASITADEEEYYSGYFVSK
jgi:hypothetical protein